MEIKEILELVRKEYASDEVLQELVKRKRIVDDSDSNLGNCHAGLCYVGETLRIEGILSYDAAETFNTYLRKNVNRRKNFFTRGGMSTTNNHQFFWKVNGKKTSRLKWLDKQIAKY